jgi:hypothetical protein
LTSILKNYYKPSKGYLPSKTNSKISSNTYHRKENLFKLKETKKSNHQQKLMNKLHIKIFNALLSIKKKETAKPGMLVGRKGKVVSS